MTPRCPDWVGSGAREPLPRIKGDLVERDFNKESDLGGSRKRTLRETPKFQMWEKVPARSRREGGESLRVEVRVSSRKWNGFFPREGSNG